MPFFDYFKVIAENNLISKNKWLIMWLITGLSASGGIAQTFEVAAQKAEKIKAIHEVAIGFQSAMVEKTTTPKIVVRTSSCGNCLKRIEKLEETQKRWH